MVLLVGGSAQKRPARFTSGSRLAGAQTTTYFNFISLLSRSPGGRADGRYLSADLKQLASSSRCGPGAPAGRPDKQAARLTRAPLRDNARSRFLIEFGRPRAQLGRNQASPMGRHSFVGPLGLRHRASAGASGGQIFGPRQAGLPNQVERPFIGRVCRRGQRAPPGRLVVGTGQDSWAISGRFG